MLGHGSLAESPLAATAVTTTPVSATSSGLHEALEGIAQTSEGLQEAKGILAVPSSSLHEAKGTLVVSSAGVYEALDGTILATSVGVHEALGRTAAQSASLHEALGRLAVTSTGLMEFLAAPVVDLSSFLFYWSAENNKRAVVGGDPLYTRDSVRWYLDPNTEKYRRVPAHYSPVSEERSFSGYDVPVLHLERAGIAENEDTTRFDTGSAWARSGGGFGSDSPVGSVFEGEHGQLFRDPGGSSASVYQTIGTVSGSQETFSVIFEVLRRPPDDRVTVAIRDQDVASFYARLRVDLASETASVIAGAGGSILRKWNRKGPNGGDVYRVAVRGAGTAGNTRRLYIYPAGASSDGTGARIVLHHAQLEEQAWASSPIVSEAAGATRATTDLFYVGGAPVTDSKLVLYGRAWKDFDGDGPGSNPALLTIGDPTGVRLVVYWATNVGFQLVNSSTNVTKTLSPVGDAGDEVEFYWALEPDWSGRVGLRVEGGTPAGADHDPIAPEGWGENRIYMNRRQTTEKGAARFESLKAFLAADLESALDGTEDTDLFDELREHRLDRRGSLYLLR